MFGGVVPEFNLPNVSVQMNGFGFPGTSIFDNWDDVQFYGGDSNDDFFAFTSGLATTDVDHAINGQPIKALLDSGASTSVLNKSDAARLGVTPDTTGVVGIGGATGLGQKSIDRWIGPFESVAIGNETIRNIMIPFADLWKDATYAATGSRLGSWASDVTRSARGTSVRVVA